MSLLQILLVFVGIPLALAAVVAVAVSAGSWTRSGRASADYSGGPLLVVSDPPVPNPSIVDAPGASVAGGGISVRW